LKRRGCSIEQERERTVVGKGGETQGRARLRIL